MTVKTIAFFNEIYPLGGGETVTRLLASCFHEAGIRILIYTRVLNDSLLHDEERQQIEFRTLPINGDPRLEENVTFLCHSLETEQVDLLIDQGIICFPFRQIRERCSCRILFCLHNKPFWEVDRDRNATAKEKRCNTLLKKCEFFLIRRPLNRFTARIKRRSIKQYAEMMPYIDRLVLLCDDYREEMFRTISHSKYSGHEAPAEKYVAICNPMPPIDASQPIRKEKIVLYVGRLVYTHKRVDRLLHIWQQIERKEPEWKLILVGKGREEAALKALAEHLNLQRVEFAGYQTDMADYYRRATFCCLTSNFEGLPMCFMEGQRYGVIPVSFDSYDGFRYISDAGRAGIAVPAFSLKKYATQLCAAMEDLLLQKRMQKSSLEVARRYDMQEICKIWLSLFAEL